VLEVRLAISAAAARALSEPRVRRLLEIELGDDGVLAPGTAGPLGDHVCYVWIDQLSATQLDVEVRVADRPVATREISIAGVGPDVATRLVAIAAAEMIRAQAQPRPRRPPTPPRPTPAEAELALRGRPAVAFAASGYAAALPASAGGLGGPGLGLSFRALGASEELFGRWLQGAGRFGGLRWLEVGVDAEYRVWLGPRFRLAAGALASVASVQLADVSAIEGVAGERDAWSARAGATVGAELRLARSLWLGLAVEPAVLLRPVRYADAAGANGSLGGAWLGLALSLRLDRPLGAPPR
jgi:hypothetical protein